MKTESRGDSDATKHDGKCEKVGTTVCTQYKYMVKHYIVRRKKKTRDQQYMLSLDTAYEWFRGQNEFPIFEQKRLGMHSESGVEFKEYLERTLSHNTVFRRLWMSQEACGAEVAKLWHKWIRFREQNP